MSLFAKGFPAGRWSFLGPGSEKKCSTYNERSRREWDRVAELMIKFSETGHTVFRATSPLSRGTLKSKGGGKLSIHFCADGNTIETFRTIIDVHQLSTYGAVSDLCEECKSCPVRTGRLVLPGQSDPLFVPTSVMKTLTPSTDDLAQEDLLHKCQERVERPGFTTLQLCSKVQELQTRLSVTPDKITGRIIFMSMFNDIPW